MLTGTMYHGCSPNATYTGKSMRQELSTCAAHNMQTHRGHVPHDRTLEILRSFRPTEDGHIPIIKTRRSRAR